MVKFSKQLEGSLVPEWKGAYCNYKGLKRDVNRIKQDRLRLQSSGPRSSFEGHLRTLGSISGLHSLGNHIMLTASGLNPLSRNFHDEDDEETVALYDAESMAGQDKVFFNHLDAELEKINHFYKTKEAEYVAQAIRLEKQLLALFEVQEALARQNLKMQTFSFSKSPEHYSDDSPDAEPGHESPLLEVITMRHGDEPYTRKQSLVSEKNIRGSEGASASSSSDEELEIIANFIENVDLTETRDHQEFKDKHLVSDAVALPQLGSMTSGSKSSSQLRKPVGGTSSDESSVVLSEADAASPFPAVEKKVDFHGRLLQTREPGEHKIKRKYKRSKSLIQDMIDMSLGKKKIQSSEKMLRTAFVEFYRGLGLLKSYCSLNMVAFAKIMKKYDKVVRHKFGPVYIREVERSYFASSDKVTMLMTKVEEIFTKYFADHDRRKAMQQLRPIQQHGGHKVTFLLGIFSGVSTALLVGFLLLLSSTTDYRTVGGRNYMDTVFRVFSTLGLLLLHMYMYGWNVYAWQRVRINYPFIFEFSPGTELRYREVFLVCTAFTSLLLGTMIAHIIASTRQAPTGSYTSEFAPLGITLVFLVALCTPVNILYRSSRIFFLRCMQRVILAPFYKVVLADFFLGDQLTSQVASFRNVEFMLCYYSGGYFHDREKDSCTKNITFQVLMYVFSLLPYSFRFWQCLRRWRDEGDTKQLYNAGKYASAMSAMVVKLTYMIKQDTVWLVLFILFSCFATLYQLYWDLVVDWGLLQPYSKNRWLRDNLILKKKYIYFVSMGVNIVLRLAWVSSIQHLNNFPGFSQAGWDTIFASLEVIRRGHWNFFRLENEHLNNVGKYRAVKTVPLPFKEFEIAAQARASTYSFKVTHRYSEKARRELQARHGDAFRNWPQQGTLEFHNMLFFLDLHHHHGHLFPTSRLPLPLMASSMGNMTYYNSHDGLQYTYIELGTPSQMYFVALDTGSDLLWLPCAHCISCAPSFSPTYNVTYNTYDPSHSTTSRRVPCDSPYCEMPRHCTTQCPYRLQYLSPASTEGYLVEDVMYLVPQKGGNKITTDIVFGCGTNQSGRFLTGITVPNGLLGLGMQNISTPSILARSKMMANSFSMCFDYGLGTGRLVLGDRGSPKAQSTPIITPPNLSYYWVRLRYIVVGGTHVLTPVMAIFDTGTTYTYLSSIAYTLVADAVDRAVHYRRIVSPIEAFELCYAPPTSGVVELPSITLSFSGGAKLEVFRPYVLISNPEENILAMCLTILDSKSTYSIIGHNFMVNHSITFDRVTKRISWIKVPSCDKYQTSDADKDQAAWMLNVTLVMLTSCFITIRHHDRNNWGSLFQNCAYTLN